LVSRRSVIESQEARRHALRLHQPTEHLDESQVPPERLILHEGVRPILPGRLVLTERLQRIPAETEEIRGQGGPHQRLSPRLRNGQEDALDLGCLVGAEGAGLTQLDAGDPPLEERLPHPVGLGVGPHQDRDVPSPERCLPDPRVTPVGSREEARNVARRGLDRGIPGLPLGKLLVLVHPGEAPEPERRMVVLRYDERLPLLLDRAHRVECDLVEQERLLRAAEHGIHGLDQSGSGAPVPLAFASSASRPA
jgi:hypothetical protein